VQSSQLQKESSGYFPPKSTAWTVLPLEEVQSKNSCVECRVALTAYALLVPDVSHAGLILISGNITVVVSHCG
jgi:hypothetical protein